MGEERERMTLLSRRELARGWPEAAFLPTQDNMSYFIHKSPTQTHPPFNQLLQAFIFYYSFCLL